ncbi:MAG: hypothetical protein JWQ35_2486 [Bacteriovoracaceae bacterium]|nr:hypothetical protein [Bacteriovoracaceae bacterium]
MQLSSILDHRSYKTYLGVWIKSQPSKGRGVKSRIAQVLRCHPSFISLVVSGDSHLSLEQGEMLNRFMGHTDEASHFFLLLIQLERSGTPELKNYFLKQMNQIIEKQSVLKERLKFKKILPLEMQARYYSYWYYPAVHMALLIPELQKPEALRRYLKLPIQTVSEVLQFLLSTGLAVEKDGKFLTGTTSVHLGADSPMTSRSHTNWRQKIISSLERIKPQDLHYSSVVSLSRSDVPRIKAALIQAIEEVRDIVKETKEEELFCYTLDLFSLKETET